MSINEDPSSTASPIFHAGAVVPVLYAGNNRETVIFETLFTTPLMRAPNTSDYRWLR